MGAFVGDLPYPPDRAWFPTQTRRITSVQRDGAILDGVGKEVEEARLLILRWQGLSIQCGVIVKKQGYSPDVANDRRDTAVSQQLVAVVYCGSQELAIGQDQCGDVHACALCDGDPDYGGVCLG